MEEESPDREANDEISTVDDDIVYAGFWPRVGATIIDTLVFVPLLAIELYNKIAIHSILLLTFLTLLMLIYKPYLEYSRGATIGKSVFNILVVTEDLKLMSLNQSILRFMPWVISSFITFMVSLEFYKGNPTSETFLEVNATLHDSYWTNLNGLYSMVFLVIVLFVAFDVRKQGIHDKIANTLCIIYKP